MPRSEQASARVSVGLDPVAIADHATRQFPAVRVAWGLAGLAAVYAIARRFIGGGVAQNLGVLGGLILLCVLLVVFARVKDEKGRSIQLAANILIWGIPILTTVATCLALSSFFFAWPRDWSSGSAPARAAGIGEGAHTCTVDGAPLPSCRVYHDDAGLRLRFATAIEGTEGHVTYDGVLVERGKDCYASELEVDFDLGTGADSRRSGSLVVCYGASNRAWSGRWQSREGQSLLFTVE